MSFFEELFAKKTDNKNLPYYEALFVKKLSGGGSGLPDAYEAVKGFTMNNDCYFQIDDLYLTGADTLKFSASITAVCNVLGSYSGSTSGANYSLYAVTGMGNYLRYYSGTYNSRMLVDKVYHITITPTGTHGMEVDSTWEELEFTTTKPFCIGTTSATSTSAKLKGSLYGHIIIKGKAVFIPCKRKADNVYGYYEKYSDTFYEPVGNPPTPIV